MAVSETINAQCAVCTVTLPPGIPADTIYLDTLPSADKNVYYEESMSFRLPHTTDPLAAVAPPGTNVPAGLNVDHFVILSVTGLPPGLSWIGDRTVPMKYDEVAPATRDGCITLCGTPAASGTYTVNVNIEIQIQGFVFPSPPVPLEFIVKPDSNATFSLDSSSGCAPFPVVFNNLMPSNSNAGISYFWAFNNGTTSTLENPDTVWYDFGLMQDTTVAVTQQVIIDTFPYILEAIVVHSDPGNTCNDDIGIAPFIVTGAPEMYIILSGGGNNINTDPNFSLLSGSTGNNEYPRDTMIFPGPIVLSQGQTYSLEIWDDDSLIGSVNNDDQCGGGNVQFSSAIGAGVHTLTSSGGMEIEITVSHFVDTVTYVDSITVQYCNVPVNYINQVNRTLQVFPNPVSDILNVQFYINSSVENVELMITDLLGRKVFGQQLKNDHGEYNQQIDLSKNPNAVYILHIRIGNDLLHRKIVLKNN